MLHINNVVKTFFVVFFLSFCANAASVLDGNTLVVYDEKVTNLDEHSQFFDDLRARDYILHFAVQGDEIELYSADEKLYQNLVIFPSKQRSIGNALRAKKLLEFADNGGNILVVTSPDGLSDEIRGFVNELGIYPSPRNYKLYDHFSFGNEAHDVVRIDAAAALTNKYVSVSSEFSDASSILYSGSGALLDNGELLVPILKAAKTSYVTDDVVNAANNDHTWTAGSQAYLIAGFQALNNARIAWIGSETVLSNSFFDTSAGANRKLAQDVTQWTFQEKAVIKSTFVEHFHTEEPSSNATYKIKDEVTYKIGLSEWNGEKWVPFKVAEDDDIQLEFTMLDPYHRVNLKSEGEALAVQATEVYSTEFVIPDQHGVFTFSLDYKRPGLSFIVEKNVVTIRHLANDEYPRSWDITNSWVYIASSTIVVIAWLVFVVLFLYTADESKKTVKKKNI